MVDGSLNPKPKLTLAVLETSPWNGLVTNGSLENASVVAFVLSLPPIRPPANELFLAIETTCE